MLLLSGSELADICKPSKSYGKSESTFYLGDISGIKRYRRM